MGVEQSKASPSLFCSVHWWSNFQHQIQILDLELGWKMSREHQSFNFTLSFTRLRAEWIKKKKIP
jgi:hypothetical protein